MATNKFDTLQAFRGLAALGVVFHHASLSTNAFVQTLPPWCDAIFSRGFLGVDFFFVLSGFIILSAHFSDRKSYSALWGYSTKRFIRIFPPYWPVSIALVTLYSVMPHLSHGDRADISLLASFFLIPDNAPPALSVAWTLIHEVQFYTIFLLFYVSNKIFVIFVVAWVLIISALHVAGEPSNLPPFLSYLTAPINLEFVAGMAMALLSKKIRGDRLAPVLMLFALLSFIVLTWTLDVSEYRILYAIPFSSLVLGAVLLERGRVRLGLRRLALLGDASYSIYLIHNPLISVASRLVGYAPILRTWWLGMLVGVISSVCIGFLYHYFIEKRLILAFRAILTRYVAKTAWRSA
jgi:exopolysaccharide production protein ExoZ